MPMMNVRPVNVCMGKWFMLMVMLVLRLLLAIDMLMEVMLVMDMGVGVGGCFMSMDVPMDFSIQKKHSRKHHKGCCPVFSGWPFAEKND